MFIPRRLISLRRDPNDAYICTKCLQLRIQYQHRRRGRLIHSTTAQVPPTPQVDFDPIPTRIVSHSSPSSKHDDDLLRRIFDDRDLWKNFSSTTNPLAKRTGLFQNKYL